MERIFNSHTHTKKNNKFFLKKHLIKMNITHFIFDLCQFEYYLTTTGSYFLITRNNILIQCTYKTEVETTTQKIILNFINLILTSSHVHLTVLKRVKKKKLKRRIELSYGKNCNIIECL